MTVTSFLYDESYLSKYQSWKDLDLVLFSGDIIFSIYNLRIYDIERPYIAQKRPQIIKIAKIGQHGVRTSNLIILYLVSQFTISNLVLSVQQQRLSIAFL